jgi:hypothetical protein
VRGKHDTDRGDHHVEGLILERQVLGVSLYPIEGQPFALGTSTTGVKQLRCQIAGGDLRAGLRRSYRRVAGPGCHIQDHVAGADAACLHERRPQRKQERLDHIRIITRRPDRAMTRLQLRIPHPRRQNDPPVSLTGRSYCASAQAATNFADGRSPLAGQGRAVACTGDGHA